MYEWLEGVKIGLSLILLSYASWHDYRIREVPNEVWVLLAPLGLILSLAQIFIASQGSLITLALSFLTLTGIALALFFLGFFGGADAKALICLSLILPFSPASLRPYLGTISLLFPLSIFDNAILTSALNTLGILTYNLTWSVKKGEKLFEGLEGESFWKKFLVLITGYKVEPTKFGEKSHLIPLERFTEEENGIVTRHLRVLINVNEEKTDIENLDRFSEKLKGKIWATPSLPFMIFITLGLVLTLFLGDIILWLAFQIIK
jgi:preflagellin peptidase FlaK